MVLTRLCTFASDVENLLKICSVVKHVHDFRFEFSRPVLKEVKEVRGADFKEYVLADIVKLVQVEKCTGGGHFLCGEFKFIYVGIRVCNAPFLKVGVEDCQQILADCCRVIALIAVVVQ